MFRQDKEMQDMLLRLTIPHLVHGTSTHKSIPIKDFCQKFIVHSTLCTWYQILSFSILFDDTLSLSLTRRLVALVCMS